MMINNVNVKTQISWCDLEPNSKPQICYGRTKLDHIVFFFPCVIKSELLGQHFQKHLPIIVNNPG